MRTLRIKKEVAQLKQFNYKMAKHAEALSLTHVPFAHLSAQTNAHASAKAS